MSEQDWQVTVLTELGTPLSGLVTADPSRRPMRSSAGPAAQSQEPTGGIPAIPSPADEPEEPRPAEDVPVIGELAAEPAERTSADPFADRPVTGAPAGDDRAIPFGGFTGEPTGQAAHPPQDVPSAHPPQDALPQDAPSAQEPPPAWSEASAPAAESPIAPDPAPAWTEQPPAERTTAEPTDAPAQPSPSWDQSAPAQPDQGAQPRPQQPLSAAWEQNAPPQADPMPPQVEQGQPASWDQGPGQWDQSAPPRPEQVPPPAWEQSVPQAEHAAPTDSGSPASWDQGAPPRPEQASPPQWEQSAPPQAGQVPSPQAEQGQPASWDQGPGQWDQGVAPRPEQAAPPAWEQSVPQAEHAAPSPDPGPPTSWDQGAPPRPEQASPPQREQPQAGQAPPPQWEQQADQVPPPPQWEQSPPPQGEQEPSSSWDPAPQAQWDQAAQPAWGAEAAEQQGAPVAPGRETWDSGSEAWQQEPGESAPQPPRNPHAPGPPQGGPQQGGPPVAGGPIAARDLVRRSAYGDPLMRRMSRGMLRAVGAAAANDVRKAADVEAMLSRPVPSCRQIAVTSIRGGAGKTTVAGLTATVIAQYRQDRVLAVDADSGLGSLPLRMGVGPQRSLHDLMSAHPQSFEEASRYLAQTTDGLWVLSGTAGGRITGELDLATFRAAAGAMSRYFAATVIDCGAGLLPELQRGILADAHAQVMVTPGTVDGALSAHGALEWQARNGYDYLLPRTVIAFVTHTPHVDADLGRAAQMLSSGGLPVVHIPYDRHLAAGTAVESARIGHETRAAVIRIAVEAFARAVAA
ncbi:MinD/ParA family protein [Actinoallomurus vinaceus]|uniref:MinD/ParA family protein n=1 Tax=Actinoallomurus vinaceus TaxID=1080074 RepID=A0ABP8UM54_9ACTN